MARLNWTPPPLDFRSRGARLDYDSDGDFAWLRITSPDIGTIEVALSGDNRAAFERQVAGDRSASVPDRLGHIAHTYREVG